MDFRWMVPACLPMYTIGNHSSMPVFTHSDDNFKVHSPTRSSNLLITSSSNTLTQMSSSPRLGYAINLEAFFGAAAETGTGFEVARVAVFVKSVTFTG